jgi:hypothetical protein
MYSNGAWGFGPTNTRGGLVATTPLQGALTWTIEELTGADAGKWLYRYIYTPAYPNARRGAGAISIQFGQAPPDITYTSGWFYSYAGKFPFLMGSAGTDGAFIMVDRTPEGSLDLYPYDSWLDPNNDIETTVNVATRFQGLQWVISTDPAGSAGIALTLKTVLSPMWGNIYLDGFDVSADNGYAMLRNTDFDSPPQPFSPTGRAFAGKVPVPGYVNDRTPPTAASTNPANGATDVPVGSQLSVTFSEPMDPQTIDNGTFVVSGIKGIVSYDQATRTAGFAPAAPLPFNTNLTAIVKGVVRDISGNEMGSDFSWTFTTGSPNDTTPPRIISTNPSAGAQNVPTNSTVAAVFDESLNPATVTSGTFKVSGAPGTVKYDKSRRAIVFTPAGSFTPLTTYTVTAGSSIADVAGNPIGQDKDWTFTTAPPPAVLTTDPADGATEVPLSTTIKVMFNKPVNPATVNQSTFLVKGAKGAVNYLPAAQTAVFTPDEELAYFTSYTATITSGIRDLTGSSLTAGKTWSFTTVPFYGDVKGSGTPPTLQDAYLALQIAAGTLVPTKRQAAAADVAPFVDGKPHPDGKVDLTDVRAILMKVIGLAVW